MRPVGAACLVGLLALAPLVGSAGPGSDGGAGAPAAAPGSGAAAGTEAGWAAVPSGWRTLAELAPEGSAPPADAPVRVEERRAYGDPALGCFALLQRATAPAKGFDERRVAEAFAAELRTAGFLQGQGQGPGPGPGPAGAGLSFEGRGVRGQMRFSTAADAGGRIAVRSVACFYNDREPERCRPACDTLLDSTGGVR